MLVNMRIISAIYLRCYTVLRDDWVSKSDTDNDLEDGMVRNRWKRVSLNSISGKYLSTNALYMYIITDTGDKLKAAYQNIPWSTLYTRDAT